MMLSRRQFLGSACAPLAAIHSATAGVAYRDYSRCFPDYLRRLAIEAHRRREAELARVTTAAALRERQRWARETLWRLIGGRPERTPLNARVLGGFERRGYRVEKVVYESQPGFPVPANLYIPASGNPPYPAVLFQMGHALNGKAAVPYQKCCQGLAQLGFLVLAFDPMGQGERVYYPDANGRLTRLRSADDEHTVPGRQMLLAGDTATRLQLWDAVRSLDYLASHPLADPKRLASTGQSGGGTLTMLLACADERLAAAAVCCGNTENFACRNFNPPGATDDAEQNLIGSGPVGFDRWDLLYPLAPKPLLVAVSAKDFLGTYSPSYLEDGREEFERLRRAYALLGAEDRIRWHETPLPHALSYELRLEVYNWFLRWLGDGRPIAAEPPVEAEADATLWAGPSGNVVRDFGSATPFTLNRRRVAKIRPAHHTVRLQDLLHLEAPPSPEPAVLGSSRLGGVTVEAFEVRSAEGVWAPAWLLIPIARDRIRSVVVILEPQGRNARLREGELYPQLAEHGVAVCAPDLRGIGDLAPEFGRGNPAYTRTHQMEEHYAWASLILGKPLVGQRVTDLVAVVRALGRHPACRDLRVAIAAMGHLTVPALFAAAIEPSIAVLYLARGLTSFRSVAEAETYDHPLANFLPGVLHHTDLPQIASTLAPRRVVLAGPVNGEGRPADPEEVKAMYSIAPNVEVRPEPVWTAAALAGL